MTNGSVLRTIAILISGVLLVTFAAPAPADAAIMETLAIASLVIVGVIVIIYLIVANARGGKADGGERWLACTADSEGRVCWAVADVAAAVASPQAESESPQGLSD